jgi:hypothetical protein
MKTYNQIFFKHFRGSFHILTIVILSSLLIIFIQGCKKEGIENATNTEQGLSKAEIKKIGTEHNRLMIDIIKLLKNGSITSSDAVNNSIGSSVKKYNVDNISLFNTINNVISNNGYQPISRDEFTYFVDNYSLDVVSSTISNTINSVNNPQQQSIMRTLVEDVNNAINYSTLSQQLADLSIRAYSELSGNDQTSTLIAIEVASNSAYMWLPESQGGLGYYDFVENIQNYEAAPNSSSTKSLAVKEIRVSSFSPSEVKKLSVPRKVGAVICADAIGAFGGFCRSALPYFLSGGPANMISNGLLLGSAVIGGVTSSATAAVGIASR